MTQIQINPSDFFQLTDVFGKAEKAKIELWQLEVAYLHRVSRVIANQVLNDEYDSISAHMLAQSRFVLIIRGLDREAKSLKLTLMDMYLVGYVLSTHAECDEIHNVWRTSIFGKIHHRLSSIANRMFYAKRNAPQGIENKEVELLK